MSGMMLTARSIETVAISTSCCAWRACARCATSTMKPPGELRNGGPGRITVCTTLMLLRPAGGTRAQAAGASLSC